MTSSIRMGASGFSALLAFALSVAAEAAEIKVICAVGMQPVMQDIGPMFERATGHKLAIMFATGGATVQRVRDAEATDVVIAIREGIDSLVKAEKVLASTATVLASTGISVAIRKGAPRPDISSLEALKRTLLTAKSITYLNPADGAASGIHFAKVLDRLGIANELKSKTVFAARASEVGVIVAKGEAEIGVLQFQLLFSVPGIDIVGPLPGDLQSTTVFSIAISGTAKDAQAAKALIDFLRTPEAVAVIKAKGMEPG
ncbi:MAG: molybdate ABC transporter substrate-binding protein [Xanthobacteraceae bacterium]|nr:molybdate ABC transporter substrate-binding protein [Xanthobacteraceae bacterium]